MSVFKSRSIIIITLTYYGLASNSPWPFVCALIVPVLPASLPFLSSVLALISLTPSVIQPEIQAIALMAVIVATHLYYHGLPCWTPIQNTTPELIITTKYLKFIYFFCFSFLSLAQFKPAHYLALLALCIMLMLHSFSSFNTYLSYVVLVTCYTLMMWGLCISIISAVDSPLLASIKHWSQQSWWYYTALSFSNWLGFLLYSQLLPDQRVLKPSSQPKNSSIEIQMHQIKRSSHHSPEGGSPQDQGIKVNQRFSQEELRGVSNKNILPDIPEELGVIKNGQAIEKSNGKKQQRNRLVGQQDEYKKQQKNQGVSSSQQQEQITNLFLLIPFTLSQPCSLQIPIYLYLFWLQNGSVPRSVFHLMFLSACAITFLQVSQPLGVQILFRLCLILVVNKNFKWAINITRLIRSIWLRSSFVLVLLILFWFSLLTVNLFHISFVLIVLLFISKNNAHSSALPSFRHRNWKYLVLLFNIFLLSRLLWLVCLSDISLVVSSQTVDVLSIIGITYDYGLALQYFNTIPLIVSGVLTVQYWTYSSRIYDLESKQTLQFLPAYRALVLRILQVLTIVYYKLIPWASHFIVLIIIISLQFSLIADFVLFWSLATLLVHMISPNNLLAYRRIYKMWEFFLKLISVQIALRYIFEFIKFPLIYTHIYQFPIIKTLISYQQLIGLAIRESSISYVNNIFTKFQLMMILDFTIIAISFLTIQYYDVMIKYCQLQTSPHSIHSDSKTIKKEDAQANESEIQEKSGEFQQGNLESVKDNSNQDAIYIYVNYIDFKITKWLQNFNEFMLAFSKLFLKLYYPVLATFSSIYYSFATMGYFLFCVYYYLKINLKYYELYGLKQVQLRVMKLFHLWRLRNNIRVNLVEKEPINTDHILLPESTNGQPAHNVQNEGDEEVIQMRASTADPHSLYRELKKEITVENQQTIFDDLIKLHTRIRPWLLLLTMACILLNYTSRLMLSSQISSFFEAGTIEYIRYSLFMFGTSIQSPISINIYLLIVALAVIQIKCCGLVNRIGISSVSNHPGSPELLKQSQIDEQKDEQETKEAQKFIDVSISLRLGLNKIMERFFVTLLVFVSLLQNVNPFSIIYLVCAWFLNYMGAKSVQGLSWTLGFLVVLQYSLIISDTTNSSIGAESFPLHSHHSWLIELFKIQDKQWISYLTFGDKVSESFVMYLSLMILMLYQFCFLIEEHNWTQILDKMFEKISIGGVSLKFYQKISQIYEYALVYSPLFIITLCLGLYLMDFTATNMFLSILSILFLFKSFLLENYTNSRPFWKSYFRILQLLIVIFMVVYCVLSTPMYNQYCNKILCSPEEFRTKITKTILLLILQIGIDLISSHHFINAMATLENTLNETSSFYRIAISIVQNDKKINKSFESIKRKLSINKSLAEIRQFLSLYENDQTVMFGNRKQEKQLNDSWLNTIISFMPSFIDSSLIKGSEATRTFVKDENKKFIQWLESKNNYILNEDSLKNINQAYINEFSQCESQTDFKRKLDQIIKITKDPQSTPPSHMAESNRSVHLMFREKKNSLDLSYDDISQMGSVRKSYIKGIMPYENDLESNLPKRRTILEREDEEQNLRMGSRKTLVEQLQNVNEEEKKTILYLQIFESLVSNWHYLTYFLMILQFIVNMGVLTLPFPFITFMFGIVYSYQAPKNVWRVAFLALLPPIFFKYALQIEIVSPGQTLQFILIGSNNTSIIIEYLLMFFIVVQCLILKIAGLYDKSTAEVECMHIALIRNIINPDEQNKDDFEQQREGLYTLLERSKETSSTFFQYLFSLYECKFGYDYSTLMVTIQLMILVYIFCFYDRMAIKEQLSFYKMIEYNQFTTGMVVMAFIQLGFILLDRIMSVLELTYQKWDVTLILKYIIMTTSLVYVHVLVLGFFPINSGFFGSNHYILVFYILHIFYFLISSLQVKVGLNKQSRGFLDRYTWYNGYIYIFYRAIPFLFEFKVFSDWTFTKTSLRLFDWIKYEQILGSMYVAKCNSLFLRGKRLGSKIEWWKKLLMGFPLLFVIILLLFGPLILFSSLNPLSSLNEITGGYLELSLRINKTNEYPFYVNTHITDIHFLDKQPDDQLRKIINTYELDQKSIQIVHLEPFSDQYWEISQGSYNKLIEQPQNSLYELAMRVKFDRNQTKATPVYVLNTYILRTDEVESFKRTLQGKGTFVVRNFVPTFMRLDNNNGLHYLTQENFDIRFHAEESKTVKKKYWVIDEGITFKMASDKYSKAIFGYSVMSFYISIILMVANYFRSLFQGSAYTIIMSDIPYADPILCICDGIYQARLRGDIYEEEMLYWTLIDIIRSPDLMKAITGNYLNARIETLTKDQNGQADPDMAQGPTNQNNKSIKKQQ